MVSRGARRDAEAAEYSSLCISAPLRTLREKLLK
jgi:hypothetical protein